ncbi:hypothetical protein CLIB1423_20S01706 [[Candida] railenensis]|uniref:BTB domain-containing protein n=1 Tax=[Candida] railenensis TaxID=45579 RepID=A0A9P0VZH7_9ASCO|nr:hypothetical protein CLIB1423_20S01706 [[Candida] railenensis]
MPRYSKSNSLKISQITGDNAPRYNVKATLVPCTGTPYVFLFGGFDEFDNLDSNVYLLNLETRMWEVDEKHAGLFREGHSAIYIGDGNILVFGGIPHDEFPMSDELHVSNGAGSTGGASGFAKDSLMMIYNVFSRTWVGPPNFTLANAPSSRSRHACCLSPDGTKVYISGGLVNSSPLNDLYCYDLVNGHWTGPIDFIARFDHFISEHNGKLYSFGGLNKDMNHVNHTLTWFELSDYSIGELVLLRKPTNFALPKIYTNRVDGSHISGDEEGDEEEEDVDYDGEDLELILNKRNYQNFNSADCEHIYMDSGVNSEIKLDVSLPSWGSTNRDREYTISAFNISEFRYMPLLNMSSDSSTRSFEWRHSFVSGDGVLYLLGHPSIENNNTSSSATPAAARNTGSSNTTDPSAAMRINGSEEGDMAEFDADVSVDEPTGETSKLTYFTAINVADLGVPNLHDSSINNSGSTLSSDFMKLLLNGDFSDFEILTLSSTQVRDDYQNNPDSYHNLIDKRMNGELLNMDGDLFKSIKVHKSILLARWPHFRRLIDSGMSETLHNMMFIAEPFLWVQCMVFSIYTDNINFESNGLSTSMISIYDYSGMLVLSNVYEIPQMRSKILHKMYHLMDILSKATGTVSEATIDIILQVWANVLLSEEPAFLLCITSYIRDRWSMFLRSKAFKDLPKDLIIRLCEDCTDDKLLKSRYTKSSSKGKNNRKKWSNKEGNTPEPDVLRLLNGSPETPQVGRTLRSSHSNSPFLRHSGNHSPGNTTTSEPRAIRTSASFPILRNYDEFRTP